MMHKLTLQVFFSTSVSGKTFSLYSNILSTEFPCEFLYYNINFHDIYMYAMPAHDVLYL